MKSAGLKFGGGGGALSCFNLSKTCRWDFVGAVTFTKLRLSPWREVSSPGILDYEIGRGPTFCKQEEIMFLTTTNGIRHHDDIILM